MIRRVPLSPLVQLSWHRAAVELGLSVNVASSLTCCCCNFRTGTYIWKVRRTLLSCRTPRGQTRLQVQGSLDRDLSTLCTPCTWVTPHI